MNDEVNSGNNDIPGTSDSKKTDNSKSGPRILIVLIFVCVSVAALVISLLVFQRIGNFRDNTEELKMIEQRLSSLEVNNDELTRRYGEIKDSINELETRQGMLQENLTSLSSSQDRDDLDWTLAEIEHLLIIATHKLALDGDVDTALAAMESADDRLRNVSDTEVYKIRNQLTSDINSLKSVNNVDVPGMALYMADIINRVEGLPLKNAEQSPMSSGMESNSEAGSQSPQPLWKRLLDTVWKEFRNLVVISKEDESGVLSLLPDQRYYLFHNLRLQLEAARLAILERDTDNLRASIELITEWLRKYFDVKDSAISNILTSLEQMYKVKLQPDLPDISSSLETIRAFVRERTLPEPVSPQTGD